MDSQILKMSMAFQQIQALEKICYNAQEFGERVKMVISNFNKPEPKRIGVVACTIRDFQLWKEEQKFQYMEPYSTQTRFTADNTIFYCITREENLRGHRFDEMMETLRARENKQYDRIVESSKYCLLK